MDEHDARFLELKNSFREHLLRPTVVHAATHSRFYGRHFGEAWHNVTKLDDLRLLPTVSKDILQPVAKDELLTSDAPPFIVQHTTGTTGQPFFVYRSHRELEFIQTFLASDSELFSNENLNILSFTSPDHGTPIEISLRSNVRNFDLRLESDVEFVLKNVRTGELFGNQDCYITGTSHQIRFLTKLLIERGCDLESKPVKAIFVTGQHVTPRWRAIIEEKWRAPLINRFSQTEGFGGATQCNLCGFFHFDHFVIPEVLDMDSLQPITSGMGILHLTSLYPFVQLMPFIRYNSGDLVEAVETACNSRHGMSIRLLGRWDYAVRVKSNDRTLLLVTPIPLFDFLDAIPDVNSDRVDNARERVSTLALVGNPRYRLCVQEGPPFKITLSLELRYHPCLYPERSAEIRLLVMGKLRELNRQLREYERSNAVEWDIQLCAPGGQSSFDPSFVS